MNSVLLPVPTGNDDHHCGGSATVAAFVTEVTIDSSPETVQACDKARAFTCATNVGTAAVQWMMEVIFDVLVAHKRVSGSANAAKHPYPAAMGTLPVLGTPYHAIFGPDNAVLLHRAGWFRAYDTFTATITDKFDQAAAGVNSRLAFMEIVEKLHSEFEVHELVGDTAPDTSYEPACCALIGGSLYCHYKDDAHPDDAIVRVLRPKGIKRDSASEYHYAGVAIGEERWMAVLQEGTPLRPTATRDATQRVYTVQLVAETPFGVQTSKAVLSLPRRPGHHQRIFAEPYHDDEDVLLLSVELEQHTEESDSAAACVDATQRLDTPPPTSRGVSPLARATPDLAASRESTPRAQSIPATQRSPTPEESDEENEEPDEDDKDEYESVAIGFVMPGRCAFVPLVEQPRVDTVADADHVDWDTIMSESHAADEDEAEEEAVVRADAPGKRVSPDDDASPKRKRNARRVLDVGDDD